MCADLLRIAEGRVMTDTSPRIDEATKEKTSGQFVLYDDGSKVPW